MEGTMKSKLVAHEAGQRTFILVLDPGEGALANKTPYGGHEPRD